MELGRIAFCAGATRPRRPPAIESKCLFFSAATAGTTGIMSSRLSSGPSHSTILGLPPSDRRPLTWQSAKFDPFGLFRILTLWSNVRAATAAGAICGSAQIVTDVVVGSDDWFGLFFKPLRSH